MSFMSFFGGPGSSVDNLSSEEFAEGIKNNPEAVILDVRTEMEYNTGHIPNAKLINIMDPRFAEKIEALDMEKHYYLYCRSGNRSMQAAKIMRKKGFEHTYNLARGVIDWNEELATGNGQSNSN